MVVTMLERQGFRGPDLMSFWADDKISMGHALLDISGEKQKQPYKTKKGEIIVFNGEMYDTTKPNDTAFLANGYDMYGLSFLAYTNWHGAIGIYAGSKLHLATRHSLLATRDLRAAVYYLLLTARVLLLAGCWLLPTHWFLLLS